VELAGYVQNPTPYLQETAVFVVPLQSGAGVRVKILDAWCRGIPVVSTSVGAEGLDARTGENIVVADDAEEFAASVIRVFGDRILSERLSRNGRQTVEASYDWRRSYGAWDLVYS
jgi:glycosyltransferase involved in cell wall biosynthesis